MPGIARGISRKEFFILLFSTVLFRISICKSIATMLKVFDSFRKPFKVYFQIPGIDRGISRKESFYSFIFYGPFQNMWVYCYNISENCQYLVRICTVSTQHLLSISQDFNFITYTYLAAQGGKICSVLLENMQVTNNVQENRSSDVPEFHSGVL